MAKILVVDDEPSIVSMLCMHLKLAGYECLPAADAAQARTLLRSHTPDVALLDVMLPGEDGFALCEAFTKRAIPVIFLTAKTAVQDRVYGLRLGADDYILKPFEPSELLARIEVILRRTAKPRYQDTLLTIDFQGRTVLCHGQPAALTVLEFDLLAQLTQNAGQALTREVLLARVWGYDYVGETRTVDVHVQRLRKKLDTDRIETVYKYGYRYRGDEA
ncbi:MAG TPA: response regulator transcription factor [Candidatus Limiplasma sp.]|nr:response regulator transcription factor [Candidatus Limiplasma sp.]